MKSSKALSPFSKPSRHSEPPPLELEAYSQAKKKRKYLCPA